MFGTQSQRIAGLLPVLLLAALLCAASCGEHDMEGNQPGECSDRADNDGDGWYDCFDPGCAGAPVCQATVDEGGSDSDDGGGDDDSVGDDDDSAGDDDDDSSGDDDVSGDDDSVLEDPCDPPPEAPFPEEPIEQLTPYLAYFPELAGGYRFAIPEALLTLQDQDFLNLELLVLHDENLNPIGFARQFFTDVGCIGGYCDAIRVVLVYDAEHRCIDVFNASADYHLKKFDLGRPQGQRYIDFEEPDMALLRSTLLEPPQVMLNAPSAMSLVTGTNATAPTQAIYVDYVVPGAAFTCWTVIHDSIETQAILADQAEAFDLGCAP